MRRYFVFSESSLTPSAGGSHSVHQLFSVSPHPGARWYLKLTGKTGPLIITGTVLHYDNIPVPIQSPHTLLRFERPHQSTGFLQYHLMAGSIMPRVTWQFLRAVPRTDGSRRNNLHSLRHGFWKCRVPGQQELGRKGYLISGLARFSGNMGRAAPGTWKLLGNM